MIEGLRKSGRGSVCRKKIEEGGGGREREGEGGRDRERERESNALSGKLK